jgi:hypothetical protein
MLPLWFHRPSISIDGVDVSSRVSEVTVTGSQVAVVFSEIPPDLDGWLWEWFETGRRVVVVVRAAGDSAVGYRFEAVPLSPVQAAGGGSGVYWPVSGPVG